MEERGRGGKCDGVVSFPIAKCACGCDMGFCFAGVALCFQPEQQHRGVLVAAERGLASQ